MKNHLTIPVILISMLILGSSCVSRKKLTYLQYADVSADYTDITGETKPSVTPAAYRIMPFDNLSIRVITPDPQWSALFNVGTGTTGLTQESAGLTGYPVDNDGNLEIPYVGKVKAAGKTLNDLKIELDSIFRNYVADAVITVRLVNNSLSIIGEVTTPGRYVIFKDRINIFEALSLAGDISVYGNRKRVQLIRPSQYGPIVKEFSLADRSILTSEFYFIMPNDIIYVMPMQGKSFMTNSTVYTLFMTTITTALVVISYFQLL